TGVRGQPPAGAQAIGRAIDVLHAVARGSEEGRRLVDVAAELDLNIATTHRLLIALKHYGLVQQRPESKSFILGPELFSLAARANPALALRDNYGPALREIARRSGDTAFLQIRIGDETLCIARQTGDFVMPALVLEVGTRLPIGAGSAGLAMLLVM